MWQCPLCQRALDTQSKTWRCAGNHSFDCAKSGYVNLLPVQNKRSLHPGDDKPMLLARRDFHQAQGYGPLMAHLSDLLAAQLTTDVKMIDTLTKNLDFFGVTKIWEWPGGTPRPIYPS